MSYYGNGGGDRWNDQSSFRGGGGDGPMRFSGGGGGKDFNTMGNKLGVINWDLSQLPVFEKNFYIEHPAVTKRTDQHAEEWRRSKGITVIGKGVPKVRTSIDISPHK